MGIRPMSAVSDLQNELWILFNEAFSAGLDSDQIDNVMRDEFAKWQENDESPLREPRRKEKD